MNKLQYSFDIYKFKIWWNFLLSFLVKRCCYCTSETTFEVLPQLCKIKYDSGTLEELLYLEMPHEYQDAGGQIVLEFAKAVQESIFEKFRVVRDGQLRIVFSRDLKVGKWFSCKRDFNLQ